MNFSERQMLVAMFVLFICWGLAKQQLTTAIPNTSSSSTPTCLHIVFSSDHELYSSNRVPRFSGAQSISAKLLWTLATRQRYASDHYFELNTVYDFAQGCSTSTTAGIPSQMTICSTLPTVIKCYACRYARSMSNVFDPKPVFGIDLSCHRVSMSA
jgi:hypothetical protein